MLNFLLAIVVESYMAVRRDLEANEVSSDFVSDVVTTLIRTVEAFLKGWPSRRDIANVLRYRIIKKSVSARMLRIASGYPTGVVHSIVDTYFSVEKLQARHLQRWNMSTVVSALQKHKKSMRSRANATEFQCKDEVLSSETKPELTSNMKDLRTSPLFSDENDNSDLHTAGLVFIEPPEVSTVARLDDFEVCCKVSSEKKSQTDTGCEEIQEFHVGSEDVDLFYIEKEETDRNVSVSDSDIPYASSLVCS